MTNKFRFRGPIDNATGGGANFQMTFENGFTVSIADTSMSSNFQRVEVAVLKDGKLLTDSMITSPEEILALMLKTSEETDG